MAFRPSRSPVLRYAAVLLLLIICLFAYFTRGHQLSGGPYWYSVLPPLFAVTLALITNRLFFSLAAAVLAGGLLSVMADSAGLFSLLVQGAIRGTEFVVNTIYDTQAAAFGGDNFDATNLQILLFVVLVMSMISVMLVSGGLQGVANWLMKYARSVRSTKLVTVAAGLVIFLDDYANTMIVGSTLRPVTDQHRISRESLAFLVDATAAPIAGIAIISTWIGYEVGLLSQAAESLGVAKDGYEMFFDALGFRLYCIGMIAFVFFNAFTGQDFGPMAAAEQRARKHGKLLADGAKPMTCRSLAAAQADPKARIHATVAIVPMAALLGLFVAGLWFDGAGGASRLDSDPYAFFRLSAWREVVAALASDPYALFHLSAWRGAFTAADNILLLAYASGLGFLLAVAFALAVSRISISAAVRAVLVGVQSSMLPVTILVLAWSLKGTCDNLQTGRFLANLLGGFLPPAVFPGLVFIVAAVTSFATGTSWGTMAILIPTAIPVAFQMDGNAYGLVTIITIAAILDGSIFGDHCSPISDTTIMSSTASSCDHLAHVRTQIPYSLVVAGIALCVGYLPAAMGVPKWAGILGAVALSGLLFTGLRIFRPQTEFEGPQEMNENRDAEGPLPG